MASTTCISHIIVSRPQEGVKKFVAFYAKIEPETRKKAEICGLTKEFSGAMMISIFQMQ